MKRVIFLIIVLTLAIAGMVYAYDDGDFQVWNTDVEEFKINNSSKITMEEEFRFADNANDFYYHHYDLSFTYNLNKDINVGAGYRHIYEKKKGKFKVENEPYMMTTLFWELVGFKFDSRNRLEYRHFDYQTDLWRYRNKFTLKSPWKLTGLEFQPFLGDEILFISKGAAFSENRFFRG